MVWNVAILSPVCVWYGCELKMSFCLNLPLVFMVGYGIILVRMMCGYTPMGIGFERVSEQVRKVWKQICGNMW